MEGYLDESVTFPIFRGDGGRANVETDLLYLPRFQHY